MWRTGHLLWRGIQWKCPGGRSDVGQLRSRARAWTSETESAEEKARLFVALRERRKGAFSRAQAVAHGVTDQMLTRRRRKRQIQRLYFGVYADFTGPVPWETRAWAAWLAYGPEAALTVPLPCAASAWKASRAEDEIHIAVPHSRPVERRAGITLSRHRDLAKRVQNTRQPPTVRLEVALLVVASADSVIARQAAILLDSCRQRRTTPDRLLAELESLGQLPRRRVLRQVLTDAADGVQSFLEQSYLRRVDALTVCRPVNDKSEARPALRTGRPGSSIETSSTSGTAVSSNLTAKQVTQTPCPGGRT